MSPSGQRQGTRRTGDGGDGPWPLTGGTVELQAVRLRYEPRGPLVLEIDQLRIEHGERVAVIGPSGCGKTTLLRLVNGYLEPEVGEVLLFGSKLGGATGRRRTRRRELRLKIGFVFQDFNLIERASVFQNVLWGRLGRVSPLLSSLGWFPEPHKVAAMLAIEEVDLVEQIGQRADTLSGGQQQRVGVARVLAQEAEIILADEPVSNLDPALADDILELLVEVSARHRATLVMSLHQPDLAAKYAQRIIGLRQGRVVWDGAVGGLDDGAVGAIYGRKLGPEPLSSPATRP